MSQRKFSVTALTIADGSATVYTPYFSGLIESIQYVKTDFTNGVDFAVTLDATGETVWTGTNVDAATVVRVRQPTHSTAGVASLYVAGAAVNDKIAVGRDRVKFVIASGGDAHTGQFVVTVDDTR